MKFLKRKRGHDNNDGLSSQLTDAGLYDFRYTSGRMQTQPMSQMTIYAVAYTTVREEWPGCQVELANLSAGDAIHLTGHHRVTLDGEAFVVGVSSPIETRRSEIVVRSHEHYRVAKPWGEELWIAGRDQPYCLKRIHITSGHKTSLQYHVRKHETNVVWEGDAGVVQKFTNTNNDDVCADDLLTSNVTAVTVIDVEPGTLHRIIALTDITLIEASTPDLDDVIRVSDDTNRGHGRIEGEHKQ